MNEEQHRTSESHSTGEVLDLAGRIDLFTERVDALLGREDNAPSPDWDRGAFAQALQTATEELRVAAEELVQQNEALAANQQALEAERQRYIDLFEFAPDGYLVTDHLGNIRQANRAAGQLLGADSPYFIGKPLAAFVALNSRPDFRRYLSRIPEGHGSRSCDLRFKPRNGREFPATLSATQYALESGQVGLLFLLKDITEREQMAQALRDSHERIQQLAHRLITVQEDERARIAYELHNEAAQLLTAITLGLGRIEGACTCSPDMQTELETLKQIADDAMVEVHNLAVSLRPVSLDRLGLVQAIGQLVQTMARGDGAEIAFQPVSFGQVRLPSAIETTLYRVVQEALTNALRHAHAHWISIVLQQRDKQVTTIIEDDGTGFEVEKAGAGNGIGLSGMRERCEMLGGSLTIESAPGKGTVIFARIPLDQSGAARAEGGTR